jgi:hypothetical protein
MASTRERDVKSATPTVVTASPLHQTEEQTGPLYLSLHVIFHRYVAQVQRTPEFRAAIWEIKNLLEAAAKNVRRRLVFRSPEPLFEPCSEDDPFLVPTPMCFAIQEWLESKEGIATSVNSDNDRRMVLTW